MKKAGLFTGGFLAVPVVTFAQSFGGVDTFFNKINTFISDVLIPLVFGIALLTFLYGMMRYFIISGDNEDSRETGRRLMLWSIVGFVMMVSIWGIVNMVAGGLFPDQTPPTMPGGLTR